MGNTDTAAIFWAKAPDKFHHSFVEHLLRSWYSSAAKVYIPAVEVEERVQFGLVPHLIEYLNEVDSPKMVDNISMHCSFHFELIQILQRVRLHQYCQFVAVSFETGQRAYHARTSHCCSLGSLRGISVQDTGLLSI